MDTTGRSELMGTYQVICGRAIHIRLIISTYVAGMESSLAYQGCSVCLHSWSPGGPLGQTQCICDGYRRFMREDHPIRATRYRHGGNLYRYGTREDRGIPKQRSNDFVRMASDFAKNIRTAFLGHKFVPQPVRWPDFDFIRYCAPDLMHDSKVFCEMVVKCLVGKGRADTSYHSWNKDVKHRRQAQILGIFESVWPGNDGPLPWRLTREQLRFLDERLSRVLWPHYVERLYYKGFSF